MTKAEAIKFVILRSIGNFLVLFALFGVVATFGPVIYYQIQFKIIQTRGVVFKPVVESVSLSEQVVKVPSVSLASILTGPKEQVLAAPDTNFSILIPKIAAAAKVFPNVDASNENEYLPILLQGVAHAKGTVFPGMPGNIYLFAHSSDNFWDAARYNAVFYLIGNLQQGDNIVIIFENVRHNYVVTSSEIVDASDISAIVDAKTGQEQLVLQTCWPPGTAWKRLLVFAKPKE